MGDYNKLNAIAITIQIRQSNYPIKRKKREKQPKQLL